MLYMNSDYNLHFLKSIDGFLILLIQRRFKISSHNCQYSQMQNKNNVLYNRFNVLWLVLRFSKLFVELNILNSRNKPCG